MNAGTGKNVCNKGKRQIKGDRPNTLQGRLTALTFTLTTALLSYSTPFSTILVFISTNFPTCLNTINYVVLKMS